MSRDQRPARTVMIAPDATTARPQRRALKAAARTVNSDAPDAVAPARSRTLLSAGVFLAGCVAGAAGGALASCLLAGR